MQSPDSIKIIDRFFKVIQYLVKIKHLRGRAGFAKKYDIHVANFARLYVERTSDIFQSAWLTYLVKDFNVSSEYLLTGNGKRFTIEPNPLEKVFYKKRKKEMLPRKPYKKRLATPSP